MKYLSSMKKELNENWLNEAKNTTKQGIDDIASAESRLLSKYATYEDTIENHTAKPEKTNVSDIKKYWKTFMKTLQKN